MKLSTYKCDGCGVLRSDDANNWWLGKVVGLAILLAPFGGSTWPEGIKSGAETHLCGVQCALAWASEQMNKILERLGGQTK